MQLCYSMLGLAWEPRLWAAELTQAQLLFKVFDQLEGHGGAFQLSRLEVPWKSPCSRFAGSPDSLRDAHIGAR